ncbi:MAG: hypothetical protein PHF86_10135 [Candidatus Nanoarchaeia archaeon]|nr:hypothetical protein [Candidatus Nanoarchaeia archaeon]
MEKYEKSEEGIEIKTLEQKMGYIFGAIMLYIGAFSFGVGLSDNVLPYLGYSTKVIPKVEQVQKGYIAPSKLEIFCKDLDGNGEQETLIKIEGKDYLLREINGKPTLSSYKVNPAEIIPLDR